MENLYKRYMSNCWYAAGVSADFEREKLTGHVICERPIVIWRTRDGDVVAYDDRCAHKRFPLSKGRLMEDGTLECAYHGMRYDVTGKCVLIPSHPTGPISPQAKIAPFPVIEQDGLVWIWPGDPEKANLRKPPRLPEIDDESWEKDSIGPTEIAANYILNIENVLDITHFYPLHDGNIGDLANSKLPVELEEGEENGNKFCGTIRRAKNYKQTPYYVDWFHYEFADRHHSHFMLSPGLLRVQLRNWPPGEEGNTEKERGYLLYHVLTPVGPTKHIWRVIFAAPSGHKCKGDPTVSTVKRIAEMFLDVAEEDRWAIENQQVMVEYPERGYQEVFLKTDLAIRRSRKIWFDLLREEDEIKGIEAAE